MKKIIVTSSVLASSIAFAGDYKINLEGRSDLTMNTTKSTKVDSTSTETKYTSFKNNVIRLNMLTNVNDSLSMRFRYRFTKSSSDLARENASDMLDYLYVDHKNEFFTARFGKQNWAETFGRESFLSASDSILTSQVKTDFNGTSTTGVGEYRFGLSLIKSFDVHKVALFASNPNKTFTATTGATKNNSVAYGLTYSSSLMDKMLQPTFAYTIAPQDGDTEAADAAKTKTVNNTLLSAGLRSEVSGFVIDADYKVYTRPEKNSGTNTSATNKKMTTKSMYANVAYAINEFTPFVSYINDKFTDDGTATNSFKTTQLAAGVMYKPFADVNFRYHLVYTNVTKKTDATLSTSEKENKASNILFGIKADI